MICVVCAMFLLPSSHASLNDGAGVEFIPERSNLGIGVRTPPSKLTVNGMMAFKEQVDAATRNGNYGKLFVSSADSELYFQGDEAFAAVKLTRNGSIASTSGGSFSSSTLTGDTVINGNVLFGSEANVSFANNANVSNLTVNGTLTASNVNFANGTTIANFFSDWQEIDLGRVYRAPTDGFVNMKIAGTDASFTHTSLIGYTGNTSSPTTFTAAADWLYGYGITRTHSTSSLMPVKKDDYFIVQEGDLFKSTGANNAQGLIKEVEWMPFGGSTSSDSMEIGAAVGTVRMDIPIDSDIHSEIRAERSPSLVFTSATTGYIFALAANENPFYRKTTDGGQTWGARVLLNTVTDCDGLIVWYDKWTPGDTGTKIHIIYNSDGQNRLYYMSLDTASSDAVTPEVAITSNTSVDVHYLSGYSITKSNTGVLYAALANYYNGNFPAMAKCSSNCHVAANWSSASNYPSGLVSTGAYNSDFKLAPLSSGKVLALYHDDAANKITYAVYTPGSNTWNAAATLDSSVVNNDFWKHAWGLTVNSTTSEVYFCYNNDTHSLTGAINTVVFSSAGVPGTISAVPDSLATYQYQCDLAYDSANDQVVLLRNVTYNAGGNINQILIQKSDDAMASWGAEEKLSLVNRDYRFAGLNFRSNESGKIYAYYADDGNNDLYGNQVVDSNDINTGWTLVYSDRFETAPTGWNNNSTITCGTGNRILGGAEILNSLSRTISGLPTHTQVKVKFNYYSLDSWDDPETGFGQIAGVDVWTTPRTSYADSFRYNLCASASWTDFVLRGQEMRANHTASSVTIGFRSTLGTVVGDTESYGIDNIEVWVK